MFVKAVGAIRMDNNQQYAWTGLSRIQTPWCARGGRCARLIVFCWTDCGTCKIVDEFRGRYFVEGCLYVRTYGFWGARMAV